MSGKRAESYITVTLQKRNWIDVPGLDLVTSGRRGARGPTVLVGIFLEHATENEAHLPSLRRQLKAHLEFAKNQFQAR